MHEREKMIYNLKDKYNTLYFLRLLTMDDLDATISLCNKCVGENLYSEKELKRAIEDPEHFFYLLMTEEQEIAGYIYYYVTDLQSVADYTKLDIKLYHNLKQGKTEKVCKIQSVAIGELYRGSDLSVDLIDFALKRIKDIQIQVEIVFGVCWKMGDYVPMKKTLCQCGFNFFSEAKRIWYDDTKLICPYCKGRCRCDAEVYYKCL